MATIYIGKKPVDLSGVNVTGANANNYWTTNGVSNKQSKYIMNVQLKDTGKKVSNTALKGSKDSGGNLMNNQRIWTDGNRYYVWVGNGDYSNGYYYALTQGEYDNSGTPGNGALDFRTIESSSDFKKNLTHSYSVLGNNSTATAYIYNRPAKNTSSTTSSGGSGGGGGGTTPYSVPNDGSSQLLKEIKSQLAELTKIYSADELAARHGIDLNYDNILADYNTRTNEYYDNMIKANNDLRTQYDRNNTVYDNYLKGRYVDSYLNAANTKAAKAARASALLSSDLGYDYNTSAYDYGMMQSGNELEEARKAELANNPYEAKDYETRLRTTLSGISAKHNTSTVQDYVNSLNAYSTQYEADRSAAAAVASANATKYSGLANASISSAGSNATLLDQYYNYLRTTLGDDKAAATRIGLLNDAYVRKNTDN